MGAQMGTFKNLFAAWSAAQGDGPAPAPRPSSAMLRRRRIAAVVALMMVASLGLGTAAIAGNGSKSKSDANISGSFSEDCKEFNGRSDKDISNVVVVYQDGSSEKTENFKNGDKTYSKKSDKRIESVTIKSGTTERTFTCPGGASPSPSASASASPSTSASASPSASASASPSPSASTATPSPSASTATPSPSASTATPSPTVGPPGTFSCRASAVRVEGNPVLEALLGEDGAPFEPFVANDDDSPCRTDSAELLDTGNTLSGPPGTLRVQVLDAETDATNGADAEASVARVRITDAGGNVLLGARVIGSSATGRCVNGSPDLSGESSVATVVLNGETIPVGAEPLDVAIPGVGTLHLNYQTEDGGVLTQRAIFLDLDAPLEDVVGDVIVAESIVNFEGNPC
jgi:hypothetical protein